MCAGWCRSRRARVHGMGRSTAEAPQPFRIEVARPGILDSLRARSVARTPPGPKEVEIEVVATGLNFMDLMLAMGMLPREATADGSAGKLLGLECAGRVVAVGDEVSEFAVGDEVVAAKARAAWRLISPSMRASSRTSRAHLSFEQAATIPIAFLTAFYSLHTLGKAAAWRAGADPFRHRRRRAGGRATGVEGGGHRLRDRRLTREAGTAHGARSAACDGLRAVSPSPTRC